MNSSSSFHSSNFSRLTEERQHTAVRSSLVGRVISEHKLLCFISNPNSFCSLGSFSLHVSRLIRYGSPVSALVCIKDHQRSLAETVFTASFVLGSISLQSLSSLTASRNSLVRLTALCRFKLLRFKSPPVVLRIAMNSSISG